MIVGARQLRDLGHNLITPFQENFHHGISGLSGGLSVAGYDVTVEFDGTGYRGTDTISSGGFMLVSTIERFTMPDWLMGVVHDKSSLARQGLTVQNTVIEPGWSGWLTLELVNHGLKPITLWRGQPIAQVVFHRVEGAEPYSGKYQEQPRGPQEAITR